MGDDKENIAIGGVIVDILEKLLIQQSVQSITFGECCVVNSRGRKYFSVNI